MADEYLKLIKTPSIVDLSYEQILNLQRSMISYVEIQLKHKNLNGPDT